MMRLHRPDVRARTTGRQTKVAFDLPPTFAVFDHDALQDRANLEQMARMTGASADALRISDPSVDLQALKLRKDHGGTSDIMLMTGSGPAVPDVAVARTSVAEAGAEWTGYRVVQGSTGPVAVVTSHEAVGPERELFYTDVFTRGGSQANAHLTVTAGTRAAADAIAARIVSTIRAVR